MKAMVITIGDELLNGDIEDTNSTWISYQLELLGFKVIERFTLPDQKQSILDTFLYAQLKADLVIISGGLGPTQDDITKECFAEFFQTHLYQDETLKSQVLNLYKKRKKDISTLTEKMYLLPKDSEIFYNDYGVAPAMLQTKNRTTYIALPGVPFEMKGLMNDSIIPYLENTFNLPNIRYHYFNIIGKGEPQVEKELQSIIQVLPTNITVSYLPSFGKVTIRLSGLGKKEELRESFEKFVPLIRNQFKDVIFSEIRNDSIAQALYRLCLEKNVTISTAESCTGGNIASQIVSIAGSSKIFNGSIVAYQNKIKTKLLNVPATTLEEYGAVSEPVVLAMATNVRKQLDTNFSVAISGIAGPTGATKHKEVGMVCIAVANSTQKQSKTFNFVTNRAKNIQLFTTYALNMLFRFILEV